MTLGSFGFGQMELSMTPLVKTILTKEDEDFSKGETFGSLTGVRYYTCRICNLEVLQDSSKYKCHNVQVVHLQINVKSIIFVLTKTWT